MKTCLKILVLAGVFLQFALGKTVKGVLSSQEARFNKGQYITSFCFYGDGFVRHDTSQVPEGKLHFYSEKRWNTVKESASCQEKIAAAEFSFAMSNISGEHRFVPWEMIDYWHVLYADSSTCDNSVAFFDDINYTIQLMNKNKQGNSVDHFSYDHAGLLSFYKVITFIIFITGSLYGHRLWQTLCKGGPMHQVIKELSVGVIYQALATFFTLTNLLWFAQDGKEYTYLIFVAIVFQSLAEFKMLNMSVKVSFGWMLGSSKNVMDSRLLRQIQLVVGTVAILEFVLTIWNNVLLLSVCKCLVAGVVVFNIKGKLSEERSSLRKDFYTSVIKSCCLWFLALPCSSLLTLVLSSYHRLKINTFVQRSAEMVAVFLLYKLFLSRSLYWEVSSLSSATLPLRLDKAFGKKNYDTYKR
ncbi:integral membrane protein GPR180-like [Dendronephthya gigantea]|uniref:integral membrane protein GPR180-like n=1 Tax=Dendronephthya gigantea TaxID=151771 RepID=UPI00106A784F|nr:integral membrane protein GPR180-like [Dendronephthya gigantea]